MRIFKCLFFLKKLIIFFFCSPIGVVHICFEYFFRTVIYRAVWAVSQSDFKCFLKRYTCAYSAIIFLGLRKRLRRKKFRVVERTLAAQLLWLLCPTLSKTIGGNADVDHSQIIGGIYPGPAPRGAFRGRAPPNDCLCPPNENCAPPSEGCAPQKLTGLGLLECKSRPKLVFATGIFEIFVD